MGAPRALALCHNFRGALDFQTGRWLDAANDLERAVDLYREVGSASGESLSLQRLSLVLTARGELDRARTLLDEGLLVAERAAMRSHCLTRLYASLLRNRLAADDEPGIRESLADGLASAERHGHCVTCNALLLPELVRAEIRLGDIDGADAHAGQLEKTAAEFESRVWTAMSAQARGRVLQARGDCAAARDSFRAAADAFAAADQPYEAARCRLSLAACLRGCGGKTAKAEADELEASARAVFGELGAAGTES